MAIQTSGVQLFGDPVGVREFRCVGSVNKWTGSSQSGTLHSLTVPRTAYRRNIWLAFDALRSNTVAPWYLEGRLSFWLNNSKITEFPISKGYYVPSGRINIFAPSTGAGQQPALRASAWETYAQDYKSVDMPCFTFDVECDKITLDIDVMILGGSYLVMTDFQLLTPGNTTVDATVPVKWSTVPYTQALANTKLCLRRPGDSTYARYDATIGTNTQIGPALTVTTGNGLFLNMDSASGGTGTQASPICDCMGKTLTKLFNSHPYWSTLTTPVTPVLCEVGISDYNVSVLSQFPTLTPVSCSVGAVSPGVAGAQYPAFQPFWDGKADLITGLIVASQYPGGL